MGKGFAPVKASAKKPAAKSAKLNPISQIQADLSSYFHDIKDPRVNRTKKHLLKDILVMAILAVGETHLIAEILARSRFEPDKKL